MRVSTRLDISSFLCSSLQLSYTNPKPLLAMSCVTSTIWELKLKLCTYMMIQCYSSLKPTLTACSMKYYHSIDQKKKHRYKLLISSLATWPYSSVYKELYRSCLELYRRCIATKNFGIHLITSSYTFSKLFCWWICSMYRLLQYFISDEHCRLQKHVKLPSTQPLKRKFYFSRQN